MEQLLRFFAQKMEQHEPDLKWSGLSILLCDDQEIRPLKHQYFDIDEVTDVISFRYEPFPGEEGCEGELIINAQRALESGPEHGGVEHELALYLAHGCDHLTGADDCTESQAAAMRERDMAWVNEAEENGLLNGLVIQEAVS